MGKTEKTRQADGGPPQTLRSIRRYCFWTSRGYLTWTWGAGPLEGFLEEVMFRLVPEERMGKRVETGKRLHNAPRERQGVSRKLKADAAAKGGRRLGHLLRPPAAGAWNPGGPRRC